MFRTPLPVRYCLLSILFALGSTHSFSQSDELSVLSGQQKWLQYTDSRNALYHHFAREAFEHLERRKDAVARINALDEWKDRQAWVKKTLMTVAGPFPDKTPLNAKIVRTLDKGSYRVEHIIFESQPGFYVTSSLFLPKRIRGKAPAIIYCSGHAAEGYRSQTYQHIILNLVRKGFVVFAFDPVGQGERLEYYDRENEKAIVGGPTAQHSYPGTQAFITGSSQARYMIWDGIRAVDYLLTRNEVDANRIGITGRSGGGTQSAYIAAFDDRIAAAAPECYITSFSRLLQSIGPQDAEQNFFHGIKQGLDHGDLLMVRAPKPTLMITTTRDFFSIQGARETAADVSRIFQAYGQEQNFGMVEDDAGHASTRKNREAMYAFFQQHLNNPGNPVDEEVEVLTEAEIRVTTTGQVLTSLGGETVFSLNLRHAGRPANAPDGSQILSAARALSSYRAPETFAAAVFTGRFQREGYAIEKYFVSGEGDYVIPFLRVVPDQPNHKTVLYLHPSGKSADTNELETLARQGFTVIAPDLPGVGELGAGDFKGDAFIGGISHNIWYCAMLIGRSIVGLQAADIARVLGSLESTRNMEVCAIARKEMASTLLHTAAINPSIREIALVEPLSSYRSLVSHRFYHSPFITGAVPGMLIAYDLPDLAATLAPRNLLMINPLNGAGTPIPDAALKEELGVLQQAYRGHAGRLQILQAVPAEQIVTRIGDAWLSE